MREGIDRNNLQGRTLCVPRKLLLCCGVVSSFYRFSASFLVWPGTSWTLVDPPVADNGISHVSVGVNVVWAVTKDRKVSGFGAAKAG